MLKLAEQHEICRLAFRNLVEVDVEDERGAAESHQHENHYARVGEKPKINTTVDADGTVDADYIQLIAMCRLFLREEIPEEKLDLLSAFKAFVNKLYKQRTQDDSKLLMCDFPVGTITRVFCGAMCCWGFRYKM